jgi:hypothetical protein
MTFEAIGVKMHLSPDTVYSCYQRGMRKIRREIEWLEDMSDLAMVLEIERWRRLKGTGLK